METAVLRQVIEEQIRLIYLFSEMSRLLLEHSPKDGERKETPLSTAVTQPPTALNEERMILGYPDEAFTYYRNQGAEQVISEEKHMGSRAVVVLCKDQEAAKGWFEFTDDEFGKCSIAEQDDGSSTTRILKQLFSIESKAPSRRCISS